MREKGRERTINKYRIKNLKLRVKKKYLMTRIVFEKIINRFSLFTFTLILSSLGFLSLKVFFTLLKESKWDKLGVV